MKTKTLLIAAVMFLALSVSAYAQSAYTVSMETLNRVACCGLAELTGSIAFTAVADTPDSITGTITLRYNLPIANLSGPYGVQVTAVGNIGGALGPLTWTASNEGGSTGVLVISVPAGYSYPNTINVFNVRVNVSGAANCGTTNGAVSAIATATGNRLTIGETDAIDLVKGVAQPLKTPVPTGTISISASNGAATGSTSIKIDENFITAFGTTGTYPDPYRSQQTLIRLKVSGIPTGVTFTFPQTVGNFEVANSAGSPTLADAVLVGPTSPQYVYYVMAAASNPALTDSLIVSPTVDVYDGPFPLAPATITISAAMAPFGVNQIPTFTSDCETNAVTFASVTGVLNTILLVPYATTEVGYDTALTVANTTLDPTTANMANFPQAIRQTGKIKIYFYPKDGSTIAAWDSTSYPSDFGLDSTGKLPAGGTFVALLSELLPSTVTQFAGYVFIVTDFTNAHGEFFVSNFDFFTHGALMLVVSDQERADSGAGRTQEQGLNQ